jgi:hypothetical protein
MATLLSLRFSAAAVGKEVLKLLDMHSAPSLNHMPVVGYQGEDSPNLRIVLSIVSTPVSKSRV